MLSAIIIKENSWFVCVSSFVCSGTLKHDLKTNRYGTEDRGRTYVEVDE